MVLQPSNYTVAGFVSGEGAVINPSALINYASANVGTQSISAALTSTAYTATGNTLLSNYTLATSASGTGTITPAPVYAIGIYGTNKVYDTTLTDPLNTAGAGLAGVVSSDASNLSLVGNAAGALFHRPCRQQFARDRHRPLARRFRGYELSARTDQRSEREHHAGAARHFPAWSPIPNRTMQPTQRA